MNSRTSRDVNDLLDLRLVPFQVAGDLGHGGATTKVRDHVAHLIPGTFHNTDRYANNRVECDHGRLKARILVRCAASNVCVRVAPGTNATGP